MFFLIIITDSYIIALFSISIIYFWRVNLEFFDLNVESDCPDSEGHF